MSKGKNAVPTKGTMNLYYKPDRTTKPATAALYILFVLACLLGLSKPLVYDVWTETEAARRALAGAEEDQAGVLRELADLGEVEERYLRYSPTDEERTLVDRMEVLALLDKAVGAAAELETVSISGDAVRLQFSDVTLAQTSRIVRALEESPIVVDVTANTARTTEETPPDVSAPVQADILIHLQKEAAE